MSQQKSLHSLCRWTFNPGKGGFVPDNIREKWNKKSLDTIGSI
jgi:xylose isomerase